MNDARINYSTNKSLLFQFLFYFQTNNNISNIELLC